MRELINQILNKRLEIIWRLVNLALFIVGLFGPWGIIFGDKAYAINFLWMTFYFMGRSFESLFSQPFIDPFAIYDCFKWLGFIGYWVLSIVHVFRMATKTKWLNIFLVLSVVGVLPELLVRLTEHYQRFWWPDYYWGYWLMLASFGSSMVLEFVYRKMHLELAFLRSKAL